MTDSSTPVRFVTGCSTGLGRDVATARPDALRGAFDAWRDVTVAADFPADVA